MAANGSKQPQVSSTLPPRSLSLQKFAEARAAELENLHSIVASRVGNDFRSQRGKRRRTTGHDNRIGNRKFRKKQKTGVADSNHAVGLDKGEKRVPRHVRRRLELRNNPDKGYCTSGDGTKRLRTHVWHAKRFTMTKLWGFHLPLSVHGRGKGSRALLKAYKDGVLIHDASYYGAVQLEGREDDILSLLNIVMAPSPSAYSEDIFHSLLSGAIHASAMLQHVGTTSSRPVVPVTYMWRASHQQKVDIDVEGQQQTNQCYLPHGISGSSSFRQLWVWLHGSAFNEGYDSLKLACQKQTGPSINCISMEGQLAKLEVMGSKSFQLLQKILHPVSSTTVDSGQLNTFSAMEVDLGTLSKRSSIINNVEHFSSSMVTSFTVSDPRALPKKNEPFEEATFTGQVGNLKEDKGKEHTALAGISNENAELLKLSLSELRANSEFSDRMNLWDASKVVYPPMDENVLCMEKHQQKLELFGLGNEDLGKCNGSKDNHFSTLCPIMLLNDSQKGSIMRWSIILPLNWVKTFWIPFLSNGARAIGLEERHWIACEVGLPHFPSDFPDCNAYSSYKATEAVASDLKAKLRPPAMRPFKIPIPPPWNSVQCSLDDMICRVRDAQTHIEEPSDVDLLNSNSLTTLDNGNRVVAALGPSRVSFEGFVARTSNMLTDFLNYIQGDHLLFPFTPDPEKCVYKVMKDERKINCGINRVVALENFGKKLCFLRVLLGAYQEGVFEEGAVICAPHFTDIKLWKAKLESDDEMLKVSESSLTSYFVEQPSGEWILKIPENPLVHDTTYRWPIGFITTGFVRGSKKPEAQALCEAALLARLREEQWNEVPVKQRRKEIYVLVRNLRSTAYRLALATIILEQQGEDVAFV